MCPPAGGPWQVFVDSCKIGWMLAQSGVIRMCRESRRARWFGDMMHTAELWAWPRRLTNVEGKVLPGLRWCNRGPLLEPDTDPSPLSGGRGRRNWDSRENASWIPEERLVVKNSFICVLVLIHSVWVWAEVDKPELRPLLMYPTQVQEESVGSTCK